ncbi:HAMP domain-containing protein [bacterium]|nr:HAMP domain-containing protein [bacterium]
MNERLTWLQREQRWLYATAVLLFLLSIVFAAREYFTQSIERNWETLHVEVDEGESALITRKLDQRLSEMRDLGARLLESGTAELLAPQQNARARAAASTRMLAEFPEEDWSFELRDGSGKLIAFAGEPMTASATPQPEAKFSILQRSPYILLTQVRHVLDHHGRTLGSLRVGTPLTTVVPINQRFLNSEAVIPALSRELDADLTYQRTRSQERDGERRHIPFVAEGDTLGYLSFHAADQTSYLGQIRRQFNRVLAFLFFSILIVITIPLFRWYGNLRLPLAAPLLAIIHIWLLRMLLHWTAFTEFMLPEAMLDPAYFASTFGGGIASAPGELLLSVLALLFSAMFVYRSALHRRDIPLKPLAAWVAGTAMFLLLPFMLRGYAASLRSFVIDSQFNYDDVAGLLSQPMFLFMIVNAYLFSLALGFALLSMYLFLKRAMGESLGRALRIALFTAGGIAGLLLLHLTTRDVLLPFWIYLLCLLLLGVPQLARVPLLHGRSASLLVPFTVCVTLGGLLTVGLFGHFMEDKRFSEIEAIAIDLARPVDGWSQVLLEQTLQYVSRTELEALPVPSREGRLDYEAAFRIWSGSPLSRLQNNSAILLLDSARTLVSRFAVGNDPFLFSMHTLSSTVESTEGIVQSTYRWHETRGRRYYKAYTDIHTKEGEKLLAVVILETPDPMQVRRQSVDLLRSAPASESLAPEDDYIISRFSNGRMVQTTDRRLERSIGLPSEVTQAFADSAQTVWSTLPVDGIPLASYFMSIPDAHANILSITRGKSVFILSVYRGLRIVVLYFAFSIFILLVITLFRERGKLFTRFTFARKLQLALLAVAAIPLLLVWFYGRDFVIEETRREIEQQVAEDLDVLRSNILERLPDSLDIMATPEFVDDMLCQEIRFRSGRDLNVYADAELVATSKPELYHVGLLNDRLHPLAYVNIVQRGKDAYFVPERIGDFAYYVGYRALRDQSGQLAAVISTPTLFQQGQVEQGFVRASATIFLFITIIAVLVVMISTALARQISRPLQELLSATRDISAGNLDRQLSVRGSAEIVDLMDSFNTMTRRLRQSQEELAAAERELAWKEMAKQVAHEIRNPLTPMKLAVQHLHRAWKDGAEQLGSIIEKVTRTLIDQIDSLSRISDEFSRFGRMPRRSTGAIDVSEALQESVALFHNHEHVEFTLDLQGQLPRIVADREEFSRALTNILRNAVQAMQDEGSIRIQAISDDTVLTIRISDTGSGIAPELLPRIFEPNFSTKTEGMGLGLAIVRKIITDAGGEIRIESAVGEGSTVIITLPVTD